MVNLPRFESQALNMGPPHLKIVSMVNLPLTESQAHFLLCFVDTFYSRQLCGSAAQPLDISFASKPSASPPPYCGAESPKWHPNKQQLSLL